jgi:DNA-binding response OmpR family regulator/DNA-binding CsgD family transcriptional regulator
MFSRPTILCIEDENDLRSDIVEELTDAGYTARQAANGIEAVKLLERERPDLVLCDITMPGLSGYGVLRAMREKGSLADVPFIFITALGQRNDLLVGKQAGADYLVKPLDYDLLLATVAARLNQVDRVRKEAVRRAEETWRELVETSRSRAIDSMRSAASAFDRFLIGVVVLDPSGKVRLVNNEAQRILDEDDGFCLSEGMLKGASAKQTNRLRECAEPGPRAEGEDEIISFPRLSNKRPYLVLVPGQRSKERDESDAVVLLVIDTEQRTKVSGETLVRLYNLTPAETRVALMLIDGKRLDQIAGELEVAQTTIVFHLKNLFRKTETHRQADLVRVLLSVPLRTSSR